LEVSPESLVQTWFATYSEKRRFFGTLALTLPSRFPPQALNFGKFRNNLRKRQSELALQFIPKNRRFSEFSEVSPESLVQTWFATYSEKRRFFGILVDARSR
jgi:hypothetical protein